MRTIHRLLFIRTDRIGDVLMNLPAIHLLRQTFPKAWVTLLVDASVAELVNGHPDIDEIITVDREKLRFGFSYRWRLVQKIRKVRFDAAVVSNPDKFFHAAVFLAGIRHRVGYRRKWPFLLTRTLADDKAGSVRHEIDSNLKLVHLLSDKMWDGQWRLSVDQEAEEEIDRRLQKDCPAAGKVVVIHPGTTNPAKRWALDRFVELCDRLRDNAVTVLLIGGAEEKENSDTIAKQMSSPPVNWTGTLTLRQLAALFRNKRVRALVSSDSGPVHVAWIQGTPVVALYAKNIKGSDPVRWGPRDQKSKVIYKPMFEITAEEVYAALSMIL